MRALRCSEIASSAKEHERRNAVVKTGTGLDAFLIRLRAELANLVQSLLLWKSSCQRRQQSWEEGVGGGVLDQIIEIFVNVMFLHR